MLVGCCSQKHSYTLCTIIMQVSILTKTSFLYILSNYKLYKLECLLDLSISSDVYLCYEGGCGLRRLTLYIKVSIIIRQLLFLRQNGPKERFSTDSEKSLSEGSSTLEMAKILGTDHRTIKCFVANSQQGR